MSDQSPVLGLPYILPAQAQKHVTHNMAIQKLDALVQLHVASAAVSIPPGSPATGDRYIVAAVATADWLGQENSIAIWQGSAWSFTPPVAGWQAHVLDQNTTLAFDGSNWQAETLNLQNIDGVGINASFDATNKLAVSADATLLNHNGLGHQLKVNKATTGDTASVLFQNNWSGRAEFGLTGDDDFHMKVSSDGTVFKDALTLENATGYAKSGCFISGRITVSSAGVGYIDTPNSGGFVFINVVHVDYPQAHHSGFFAYDTGLSLACISIFTGSGMENHSTTTLTGLISSAGQSGFAVRAGQLQIENRYGGAQTYAYTFIGGI